MQRRIRANLLADPYGTSYQAPTLRTLDVSSLSGGLNLWELEYKLDKSQSPDMVNMYWKDGSLSSRPGQSYIYDNVAETSATTTVVGASVEVSSAEFAQMISTLGTYVFTYDAATNDWLYDGEPVVISEYGITSTGVPADGDTITVVLSHIGSRGAFYGCYSREWIPGYAIAHKGTQLFKINLINGVHTPIYTGLTEYRGTFFVFGSKLYYMNRHEYIEIDAAGVAQAVVPYVPITVMNRTPDGAGGDLYQPENRLAAGKEVWFTADGTATKYVLPYNKLASTGLIIKYLDPTSPESVEAGYITLDEGTDYTVDRPSGVVTFTTAPAQSSPIYANNVQIRCFTGGPGDTDTEAQRQSILSCRTVTTYGTSSALTVVCGGPDAQPNAYFWSGNHAYIDPTYFPYDYYNLAGNADTAITGFGRQQSMLVIFKERSIGKCTMSTQTVSGREYLNLSYTPVNDSVGCDVPGSIRLIQNNILFANTYGGVHVLLDTSSAGENNIKRLSRNVNGEDGRGLLNDLRLDANASCYDDDQRYWLCANGHAYLWDYTIRSYSSAEGKLSWFYFTNIRAEGWLASATEKAYYFTAEGCLSTFIDAFIDYTDDGAIERRYTFATQDFGTYEVLKDVTRVIFAVRSDTDTEMRITYKTDYETRDDLTPIRAFTWRLVPRNLIRRSLAVIPFASTHIRVPRCLHVRHFSMTLSNNDPYTDMSLISAQIVYRYSREDR